ncbi:MAG: mechanosensitive ion channel domain-containing protein [Pseudomonadota bacterium]
MRFLILLLVSVTVCLGFGARPVSGQEASPTLAGVEQQIEAVQARDDLLEDTRTRTLSALETARALLRATDERRQTVQRFVDQAARAEETRAELAAELEALRDDDDALTLPETSEGLRSRLNFLVSERALAQDQRGALLEEQAALSTRSAAIAEEIALARSTLTGLEERTVETPEDETGAEAEALETLRATRLYNQRTAIEMLQRELQTIPQRQPILADRLALIEAQISRLDRELNAIQKRLSDVRMDLADSALERSVALESAATGLPEGAQVFAAEHVALANRLRTMAENALENDLSITEYGDQVTQVRQQAATVNRVIATGRISGEIGTLLRQVSLALPDVSDLRDVADDLDYERVSLQLDMVLWQDQLRSATAAADPRAWIEGQVDLPVPDEAIGEESAAVLRDLLDQRIALLRDLIDAGNANSDRLTDLRLAVLEVQTEAQELRSTLDRRLFWLPSTTRPLRELPANLISSVSSLGEPALASGVAGTMMETNQSRLWPLLACAAGAILILLFRSSMQASLETLNTAVGRVARDRYWTTPFAILQAALLSAPVPLLIAAAAISPLLSNGGETLATPLATGVCAMAALIFIFSFIATLRREGVLQAHFNWSDKACARLGLAPPWFLALTILGVFVTVTAAASGRQDLLQGIGVVSFMVASMCFAVLGFYVFRFDNGWLALIVSRGVSTSFLFLGLLAFVLAPLVIGALPLLGYVETAVALQLRLMLTAGVFLLVALVYGILNRQLLIAQRRLVLRNALQRRAEAGAARQGDETDDPEDAPTPKPSPEDVAEEQKRISNQARRILIYLSGIAALSVIATIWATILPAFGIANEVTVWTGSEVIDGVRTDRPVTLWNLILFVAFIGAGTAGAYNVRGLLELGLFQRLNVSAGSRYAIVTIIGYLLFGTGVVAGFQQLGLDWSRLQWIIAALGVGLGFGLQEIVANFISGVIILFERPVRVGDFVTIGELEGTVSNIAIRATTITDFDNREVLLPNKSIITENVTNWTLRDSVLRIIIPIGVAYGSDVNRVRDLLMEVAEANEDVLDAPVPRVFFMEHGDSSLDFEVRVFISNPRKRFRVRDEINTAINQALTAEKIEIPFPQRDLHVRTTVVSAEARDPALIKP